MVHRHMAAYQLFYMSSMLIQKARGGHELCHIHISLYACACIYEYQTWMSHKYGHVIHNGAVEVSHLDVICGYVIFGAQVPHLARERARERERESARERESETTTEKASESARCDKSNCYIYWILDHFSLLVSVALATSLHAWFKAHTWMGRVTCMEESCLVQHTLPQRMHDTNHTCEWVMSHIWGIHFTHLKEPRLMQH